MTQAPLPLPTTGRGELPAQSVELYLETARGLALDEAELLAGTSFAAEPVPRWIPWDEHVRVCDRIGERVESWEALYQLTLDTYGLQGSARHLMRLMALASGQLTALDRVVAHINHNLMPALRHDVVVDGNRLMAVVRIPEDLKPCQTFIVSDLAATQKLCEEMGLRLRDVRWESTDRWGRFEAEVQLKLGPLDQLRRWFRMIRGAEHTIDALTTATEGLEQALAESEEARLAADAARREALQARHEADLAKEEALRALAARDRLLSVVSHELRTPLHQIAGCAELLRDSVPPEHRELVVLQLQATQALDEKVAAMLQVAEGAAEAAASETLTLGELANRTIGTWQERHPERIQLQFGEGQAHLPAPQIGAILDPLLDNGLRFGSTVTVTFNAADGQLQVDVRDDGPGFGELDPEQLLQPFVQGDSSNTRSHQGLGLGLTLARERALGLGGELHFVPSATGAHVRLTVPLSPAPDEAPAPGPEARRPLPDPSPADAGTPPRS